jgi:hypothetical protein
VMRDLAFILNLPQLVDGSQYSNIEREYLQQHIKEISLEC